MGFWSMPKEESGPGKASDGGPRPAPRSGPCGPCGDAEGPVYLLQRDDVRGVEQRVQLVQKGSLVTRALAVDPGPQQLLQGVSELVPKGTHGRRRNMRLQITNTITTNSWV
ncbi:hypothetical protein EYF80_033375 [Liparis tanakae]|uniref:Uncharacterized protein n=1 Tax=Liparis tanakae TaxID=230148 RepID=A0A4Z2GUY6_9TELE|nr:hypothetical protein EYF80_033375 [Liparis tanakae]